MADKVSVAMESLGHQDMFWTYKKQKRQFLFLLTSFLHEKGLTTKQRRFFSLILTTADRRVILGFHSIVYDVVRVSRIVIFWRAKFSVYV